MIKIIDCIQGTEAWHAARCGRVTGSRVCDIVRKTKTGVSKMRATYMGELIAERLAGVQPSDGYVSTAMQWGKEMEDRARATYAYLRDAEPVQVGFVLHPTMDMAGASPDSLVGEHGGLEAKCPNSATHIETLLGAEIEPDYLKQLQWNMTCAKRAWWDYISFDPRLPASMQLYVRRVPRDDRMIAELESAVREFIAEIDTKVAALRERFDPTRKAA